MVIVTHKIRYVHFFAVSKWTAILVPHAVDPDPILFSRTPAIKKNKLLGNVVFWLGLYAGLLLLCCLYCLLRSEILWTAPRVKLRFTMIDIIIFTAHASTNLYSMCYHYFNQWGQLGFRGHRRLVRTRITAHRRYRVILWLTSIYSCQIYLGFQNNYLAPENPRRVFPHGQLKALAMRESQSAK